MAVVGLRLFLDHTRLVCVGGVGHRHALHAGLAPSTRLLPQKHRLIATQHANFIACVGDYHVVCDPCCRLYPFATPSAQIERTRY